MFLTTLRAEDSEKMGKEIADIQVLINAGDTFKKDDLLKLEKEQVKYMMTIN
mgnify:CR=1 FL=1